VIFGTLDSSDLLRRADAARSFPVRVHRDGVIVRDPLHGDRRYIGEQFGALLCAPNPLTDAATYIVIANRRVFTQPDGGVPQLLAYDLEKLPWAYPDYVVFNNDQSELPFVLNVNNKPPVTCYEAAYFVEAGFFDERWGVDRARQLRRVRRQKPEEHRLVHITELALQREGVATAIVRIEDAAGAPVDTARVTGRWWGAGETVASASTDEDGRTWFPAPTTASLDEHSFEVVGVMATGCTWDWTADRARRLAPTERSPEPLDLVLLTDRPVVAPHGAVDLTLAVCNAGPGPRRARVTLVAPSGRLAPTHHDLSVEAGGRTEARFTWWPQDRPAGPVELRAEAHLLGDGPPASSARPVPVTVLPDLGVPVLVLETKPTDQDYGVPWKVAATLRNLDPAREIEVVAHCAIMEALCYPAAKSVSIEPGGTQTVTWTGPGPLPKGEHTVRVAVEGSRGGPATGKLAVR
jgi:hypothetical protein